MRVNNSQYYLWDLNPHFVFQKQDFKSCAPANYAKVAFMG